MTEFMKIECLQCGDDIVDANDGAAQQLAQRRSILDRERVRRPSG
jgi:hypothetical protein